VRKYLFDNRWVFDTGDQLDGTGIFAASISLLEGPQLAVSSPWSWINIGSVNSGY